MDDDEVTRLWRERNRAERAERQRAQRRVLLWIAGAYGVAAAGVGYWLGWW